MPFNSAPPIIKMEDVNFWYNVGKPYELQALKDVNVEIHKGEYVAFFGPSGSGKTSILYLIAGVEPSQKGKIFINGRDIGKFNRKELAIYRQIGVGIVFQQFNLIPTLSVLNNVALPMTFLGIDVKKREIEAKRLLDRLAIGNLAERLPFELSGGQQQRVGIARALANNPPIIIADEPLGNLDSTNSKKVLEFMKELNEKDGRTIIMVTHEAWSLRDVRKIFYLRDGAITKVEETTPQNVEESVSKELFGAMAPQVAPLEALSNSLTGLLLRGYSKEEISRFQFYLSQRLNNRIGVYEFRSILDKAYREGGIGLWRQKANQISTYVEDIISQRKHIEDVYLELTEAPTSPLINDIINIRNWLLQNYKGQISELQALRLDELINERLRSIITTDHFQRALNLPRSKFGVGFSLHTAQSLSEKLDLALERQIPEIIAMP
ncbi:MAG: ABC transporter ATP-binding protein [Candidatus Doudnabacteria bacterium]|nr:ABC transporter ATP-binding protein [Candidatus Doudnabacteria bacterium]